MSRSPRMNQSTPPSSVTTAIASRVSPATPQPCSGWMRPGQRVEQRVEIGRDREAPVLEVVADVADDRHLAAAAGRRAGRARSALRPRRLRARSPRACREREREVAGRVDVALDARPAAAACRRGAPRCRARSSGGRPRAERRRSAFVVPSSAATSASGRACAISSRTSAAVTCGRSAASTTTPSRRGVALERERDAAVEVAAAVVERVGAERARRARAPRRRARRRRPADRPRGRRPRRAAAGTARDRCARRRRARRPDATCRAGSAFTGTSASHPRWERATIEPSLCLLLRRFPHCAWATRRRPSSSRRRSCSRSASRPSASGSTASRSRITSSRSGTTAGIRRPRCRGSGRWPRRPRASWSAPAC